MDTGQRPFIFPPAAKHLIANYGISGSFITLGIFFAIVIVTAAQLLANPASDYRPAGSIASSASASSAKRSMATEEWSAASMLGTWQFYAMLFLFVASAQSGLLVIANAAPILNQTAQGVGFLAAKRLVAGVVWRLC